MNVTILLVEIPERMPLSFWNASDTLEIADCTTGRFLNAAIKSFTFLIAEIRISPNLSKAFATILCSLNQFLNSTMLSPMEAVRSRTAPEVSENKVPRTRNAVFTTLPAILPTISRIANTPLSELFNFSAVSSLILSFSARFLNPLVTLTSC